VGERGAFLRTHRWVDKAGWYRDPDSLAKLFDDLMEDAKKLDKGEAVAERLADDPQNYSPDEYDMKDEEDNDDIPF
jgi:hypothetical protein